jgi:hypothetical protein
MILFGDNFALLLNLKKLKLSILNRIKLEIFSRWSDFVLISFQCFQQFLVKYGKFRTSWIILIIMKLISSILKSRKRISWMIRNEENRKKIISTECWFWVWISKVKNWSISQISIFDGELQPSWFSLESSDCFVSSVKWDWFRIIKMRIFWDFIKIFFFI